MLGLPLLLVVALGRVHVPAIFGDHVGHDAVEAGDLLLRAQRGARAVAAQFLVAEDEVVHRVDVFEQFALGDEAHAAGLAGRVEFVRDAVGLGVEVVIVLDFVDAHAPDDDRGMVPVAPDHAADILDRLGLPGVAADMLPAGDFLEHEQAELVAAVEEVLALRVVRGAHHVEVQFVLQDLGVLLLRGAAQGVAGIGEGLVAVEAAQLQRLAVELEALGA